MTHRLLQPLVPRLRRLQVPDLRQSRRRFRFQHVRALFVFNALYFGVAWPAATNS